MLDKRLTSMEIDGDPDDHSILSSIDYGCGFDSIHDDQIRDHFSTVLVVS